MSRTPLPGVRRAAVLGKPIAHSLSPVIHNAGYPAAGLDGWAYTAIECAESELPALVAGLGPEWAGLSLTMPLKEVALTVAAEAAPVAATIGAANTLVRRPDGSWYADNTDVTGMVEVLGAAGVTEGARIALLGGGGTARAALAAAAALRAREVTVWARRGGSNDTLPPVAAALGVPLRRRDWPRQVADWADDEGGAGADVVISTVPKGVADHLAAGPAAPGDAGHRAGPAGRWRPDMVVFDVVYDPWPTPLAGAARAAGARVVSGLDLLLAQAVGQFEWFTGVPAPLERMRAALAAARAG